MAHSMTIYDLWLISSFNDRVFMIYGYLFVLWRFFCDLFNDSVNNTDPGMAFTYRILTRITGKGEDMKIIGRASFDVS
jgi:hypothetical protein